MISVHRRPQPGPHPVEADALAARLLAGSRT
jgi:hypothetical protein